MGDGTVEDNLTTTQTHTYTTAGTYIVSITGVFPAIWIEQNVNIKRNYLKLHTIEQWGDNEWKSFKNAFAYCENMTYKAIDIPNLSKVTDMSTMFLGCSKFNGDINNWDVSTITDMIGMFEGCNNFNGNLNNWDVSKVIYMNSMFERCDKFNGDLSNWDVSKVTEMAAMFSRCSVFNGNLSNWDISKVTNMAEMLEDTNISESNYDVLLTKWSALPNLQSNVPLGVEGLTYCDGGIAGKSQFNK